MILIICAWLYYFLMSVSIGSGLMKLISKFTGDSARLSFGVFYNFWFGFAVLIGLLQLISLFLPMSAAAFVIVSLLAIVLAAVNYRSVLNKLSILYSKIITPKGFFSLVIAALLVMLVAYSANRPVLHADTFLYHFNAVKWAKEYPVVPGLANLHSRLGFNSSFFLFAALTDIGIYSDQSTHIALSLLMAACLLHWFFIISNRREGMPKRIFCLMTSAFLINHIISQIDITSLSTDYPMAVLTLVFCVILLDKVRCKPLLLLPISAVVFSFKLSGMLTIGLGLVHLAGYIFILRYGYKSRESNKAQVRALSASFILFCFIVSGFIIRNVIVSGWLIYPFPVGNLNMPWSIPKPYVSDMIDWIKSYPKIPGGASPSTIHGNDFFFWFNQWFNQFKLSVEFNFICAGLLVLLWSVFQVSSPGRFLYARLNAVLLLLFSVASIAFWFISAPELRFGSVYFYLFFASALLLLYEASHYKNILKVLIFSLFIYQSVDRIPSYVIDREPNLFTFAYTKQPELNRVVGSPPDENPPLLIFMPAAGDACGDSPLPCTPYAGGFLHNHRPIRQRVPGDLSKGFLPTK